MCIRDRSLCEQTVVKPKESKERIRSEKIDRVLTGKYTAIPCFVGIMVLVFYLTFNVIGAWLQGILQLGIDKISVLTDQALTAAHVNHAIHSLVIEGIFTGVGSVLSFLPIIVTLFFFLSLMEDSGYIARVAFVMDKVLRLSLIHISYFSSGSKTFISRNKTCDRTFYRQWFLL